MSYLYKIYSLSVIGGGSYFYKIMRALIRYFVNLYFPIYYRISSGKERDRENVIVSLTTFPARIGRVWIVIESILRQSKPPKRVVLTLSRLQFKSEKALPGKLLALKGRGLEIIWTDDDLRSHKKYYYVMKKYPRDVIVTVDDDFIYESGMLEKLIEFHSKFPGCIVTNLGLRKKGANYSDWQNLFFEASLPTMTIMPFGGSGVLYPPGSLHVDAFDKSLIQRCCPLADDIWLNVMSMNNNIPVVKTDYGVYLMPLLFRSNLALYTENVLGNKNNEQIQALLNRYPSLSW